MNRQFAQIRVAARKARSAVSNRALAVGTALSVPMLAMAQATDPFDAAMTTVSGKVESYGGALVGLAAVAVVFFVAIKYVKKISKAA